MESLKCFKKMQLLCSYGSQNTQNSWGRVPEESAVDGFGPVSTGVPGEAVPPTQLGAAPYLHPIVGDPALCPLLPTQAAYLQLG